MEINTQWIWLRDCCLLYEFKLCGIFCFFNPCVHVPWVKIAKLKNKNNWKSHVQPTVVHICLGDKKGRGHWVYWEEGTWTLKQAVFTTTTYPHSGGHPEAHAWVSVCLARMTVNFLESGLCSHLSGLQSVMVSSCCGDWHKPRYGCHLWVGWASVVKTLRNIWPGMLPCCCLQVGQLHRGWGGFCRAESGSPEAGCDVATKHF